MALTRPPVGTKVRNVFDSSDYRPNLGAVGTVIDNAYDTEYIRSRYLEVEFPEWKAANGTTRLNYAVLFMDDSEFEVVE